MKISVESQAMALLGAVLLGCCVGLLYDILRILRVRCHCRPLSGLLDVLFWICSVPVVFFHTLEAGNGEVRLYMLLGLGGGVCLYFLLLSRGVLFLGYKIADVIGVIFHIFAKPVGWIWHISKKIQKKAKNIFLSWHRWYKIKWITKRTETSNRNMDPNEGGTEREVQTSGFFNETDCFDSAGLYGHLSPDAAGSNCVSSSAGKSAESPGRRSSAKKRQAGKRHRKQRKP
jgi:spore cortex biosynthesis protein YabQ